jgi:hypothetical protein
MDVDDAKMLEEAKAILKEITDPSPDSKEEQIEIWEAWFDRMADGGQPVRQADAPPRARIQAIAILLDRGWGRPPQPHTGEDDKDIEITIRNIVEGRR